MLDLTVNELLIRFPRAITVMHRFGIDACCGGGLTLREVIARHGIDARQLLGDLAPFGWTN